MEGDNATIRPAEGFGGCISPSDPIEYVLVDAFTGKAFEGNPAAVVFLPRAKDEKWMQHVAAEFNISQTAFLVRTNPVQFEGPGKEDKGGTLNASGIVHQQAGGDSYGEPNSADETIEYQIRWFTPTSEVDICGHGTLASAHALFSTGKVGGDTIIFHGKCGKLTVRKVQSLAAHQENEVPHKSGEVALRFLELNFPMTDTIPCDKSEIKYLSTTLNGIEVISVTKTPRDLIVELSSREDVENLQPQMHELLQCGSLGILMTAKDCTQPGIDFVSRCFFPKLGVNEDPVCGSAHCALAPFWAAKLGKDSLEAHQVRGLFCGLKQFSVQVNGMQYLSKVKYWSFLPVVQILYRIMSTRYSIFLSSLYPFLVNRTRGLGFILGALILG